MSGEKKVLYDSRSAEWSTPSVNYYGRREPSGLLITEGMIDHRKDKGPWVTVSQYGVSGFSGAVSFLSNERKGIAEALLKDNVDVIRPVDFVIAELERKVAGLENRNAAMRKSDLHNQIKVLVHQRDTWKKEAVTRTTECDMIAGYLKASKAVSEELDVQISQLRWEVTAAKRTSRVKELEESNLQWDRDCAKLQAELDVARTQAAALKLTYEKDIASRLSDVSVASAMHNSLRKELEEVKEEASLLRQDTESLRVEYEDVEGDRDVYYDIIEKLKVDADLLQGENDGRILQLQGHLDVAALNLDRQKVVVADLRGLLSDRNDTIAELRQEINEELECDVDAQHILELIQRNLEVRTQLQKQREQIAALEQVVRVYIPEPKKEEV